MKRPPFGAASLRQAATPGTAIPGELELRGIFGSGDSCVVSLRRAGANAECRWVRVGETSGSWKVLSVDVSAREALVDADGKTQTLKLAKPDGQPLPVSSSPEGLAEGPVQAAGPAPAPPMQPPAQVSAVNTPVADEPAPASAPRPRKVR